MLSGLIFIALLLRDIACGIYYLLTWVIWPFWSLGWFVACIRNKLDHRLETLGITIWGFATLFAIGALMYYLVMTPQWWILLLAGLAFTFVVYLAGALWHGLFVWNMHRSSDEKDAMYLGPL